MFTTSLVSLAMTCGCWPCQPAVVVHPRPAIVSFCRPCPTVVYSAPCMPAVPTPAMNPTTMKVVEKKDPPAKEKSLYERLGGEAAIKAVIDDFVGRAAGDPKVNFTRKGTPMEWQASPDNVKKLKMHLVDLVGMVTGGPQKYTGRSMKDSHKGMGITTAEFTALAGHLKATLDKFKVPEKEQNELLKIVGGTAADIVEKK